MMTIDRRHFLIASATAAVLAALPAPVLAAKKAKSPVAVKNPAALAGMRQAVIGSFAVGFLTERIDRAKAGGGLMGGGFGGRSTARSYLAGLADADFSDPARWREGVAGVSQEAFAMLTASLSA